MSDHVVLLSIPGLAAEHLVHMPNLREQMAAGDKVPLEASFPAVTCSVQANMTTGVSPSEHGVVANGFFWRELAAGDHPPAGSENKAGQVELWTAWNTVIQRPQIWDLLHQQDQSINSAMWFALHNKGCGADNICTFAPIHNPDGSESLWCYTRPEMMYGNLRDQLGHFPLKHFWGPLAGIQSTAWIVSSAIWAARAHQPNFWYIYLPHLDYATQKQGPQSTATREALHDLDIELGRLFASLKEIYADESLLWVAASEYVVTPVSSVTYPNRILRELGLLELDDVDGLEQLNVLASRAFAMADHQHSHVFVHPDAQASIGAIVDRFRQEPGIDEVLTRDQLAQYQLDHPRSGDVVLISNPDSWQAYYWWLDDAMAPTYSRTVDIHRKPGYDPVELFFDPTTKSIPLDATLVQGSHGAPVRHASQQGVLLTSRPDVLQPRTYQDTEIASLVLKEFSVG